MRWMKRLWSRFMKANYFKQEAIIALIILLVLTVAVILLRYYVR